MSDASEPGVLYTDFATPAASAPAAALWSYRSHARERGRSSVTLNPDGNREYWLHLSDPLLNTILPGAHVSVIVNFGDVWASGRSLPTSALVPRVCVMGPFTQPRLLRVGRQVRAIGVVLSPMLTTRILGVPAAELVDQVVPLEELWGRVEVEELLESLSLLATPRSVAALRDRLLAHVDVTSRESLEEHVSRLIQRRAGRVSIDQVARSVGLSRQQLARRFRGEAGVSPKVFARVARFQRLVQVLLSTDVSHWASVSPAVGFYDQAHMVNEFRAFAGAPPTVFFQPHGDTLVPAGGPLRGRPSEWACWSEVASL